MGMKEYSAGMKREKVRIVNGVPITLFLVGAIRYKPIADRLAKNERAHGYQCRVERLVVRGSSRAIYGLWSSKKSETDGAGKEPSESIVQST